MLLIVGITLSTLCLIWWTRFHRLPTLRFTFVIGKGGSVDVDWIDLKANHDDGSGS
jgi:hypothetical protein